MARSYWLVKSEPGAYAWSDLVRERATLWEGVRNAEARNNLAAMARGDAVLYYHSGDERRIVGVAVVTRRAAPDPTADDPRWLAVELAPREALARPVPLSEVKADALLAKTPLVTRSRLSVMPIGESTLRRILALGGAKGR